METSITNLFTTPSIFFKDYIEKNKMWILAALFYLGSIIILACGLLPFSLEMMKNQPDSDLEILEQYKGIVSGLSIFTTVLSTLGSTVFMVIFFYLVSKILSYKLKFKDVFRIYFWTKVPVGISNMLIGGYFLIFQPTIINSWLIILISAVFGVWSTILMIYAIKSVTPMQKSGLIISGSLLFIFWIVSVVSSYSKFVNLG